MSIFWESRIGDILQLMTLAGGFNHHGTVFNFDAMDVNPALRSDQVLFVALGKSVIIDDRQPVVRRAGNTF